MRTVDVVGKAVSLSLAAKEAAESALLVHSVGGSPSIQPRLNNSNADLTLNFAEESVRILEASSKLSRNLIRREQFFGPAEA